MSARRIIRARNSSASSSSAEMVFANRIAPTCHHSRALRVSLLQRSTRLANVLDPLVAKKRSRRFSPHRGSHAAFRSQIRSQDPPPKSARPESTVSGSPKSRGDELLSHANRIRMDAAGPVTAAYDPCSDG